MIVQVNYQPEKQKDFNSSWYNITLADLEQEQLNIITKICFERNIQSTQLKINSFADPHLSLSNVNLNNFLIDLDKGGQKELSDKINNAVENYLNYPLLAVRIGNIEFNSPLIMGILNITPDSFSDGGKYLETNTAVNYALEMISNGADIIDIGGESTRPGSEPVSEEVEIKRVIPVIRDIIKKNPEALISIDTTKSNVAFEACKAGAKIINDISGLTFDPAVANAAAEYSASLIVMHIKGTPKTMQVNPVYDNLIFELYEFLYKQTEKAKSAGVKDIIIDPGIGFGKTAENNFEILKRLTEFRSLGYPLLIGLSRKSFLGKTLGLDLTERDTATAIAETIAIKQGAKIIRTHNVSNAVQIKKLTTLISD